MAVGFYVISQPILDFGFWTLAYLDLPRLTSVQVAQSNDFGFVSPMKALWNVPLRGSKLRVSVSKSCLGQGMNQKI
ncbi:hypothetical protein [uncultured Nostoc sp.]|uniref:hypothetical protein n=1 Tax=uncultured Nostoc sp. TaxID=340711 RepID=UPI0035CBA02D